jgi:hypothetical protein
MFTGYRKQSGNATAGAYISLIGTLGVILQNRVKKRLRHADFTEQSEPSAGRARCKRQVMNVEMGLQIGLVAVDCTKVEVTRPAEDAVDAGQLGWVRDWAQSLVRTGLILDSGLFPYSHADGTRPQ